MCCEGGFIITEHTQKCYEISYIVSGRGYYYHQRNTYPVEEGDVFLCLPGVLHDGEADRADPFRYFYLGFGFAERIDEDNPLAHIKKMFDQAARPIVKDQFGVGTVFINLFSELINPKDYSSLMIRTYLYQIIVLSYRNFFNNGGKAYMPEKEHDEKVKIIYKVINYIDENLGSILDLSSISGALGYSYTYLSHIFSKQTGLSIKKYYDQARFRKAVSWLMTSDYSITKIAEMLQYQNIHTFSKAFRRNLGVSPSEYQSLYRNNKI